MKKNVKFNVERTGLKVLSKKDTRNVKGGNTSAGSSSDQTTTTEFVIEEIIQI